jgi:hypothetical protein
MDQRESPCDTSAISMAAMDDNQLQINPDLMLDLTDPVVIVNDFHVDDRVERLASVTERSHWGTITSQISHEGPDYWLVLDNDGVTHLDPGRDLAPARRGQFRRQLREPGSEPLSDF